MGLKELNRLVKKLNQLESEGWEYIEIQCHSLDGMGRFCVYGYRLETDEEEFRRTNSQEYYKKEQERRDFAQYMRLQAKYNW